MIRFCARILKPFKRVVKMFSDVSFGDWERRKILTIYVVLARV